MLCNLKASPTEQQSKQVWLFGMGTRLALACSLCLLSIAFAMEAKIAWYGPLSGPGSEVRAAKAMPADVTSVIVRGHEQFSSPFHLPVSFTFLALAIAAFLSQVFSLTRYASVQSSLVTCHIAVSISLPFRAPPAAA